jgi:hypothetical protein
MARQGFVGGSAAGPQRLGTRRLKRALAIFAGELGVKHQSLYRHLGPDGKPSGQECSIRTENSPTSFFAPDNGP